MINFNIYTYPETTENKWEEYSTISLLRHALKLLLYIMYDRDSQVTSLSLELGTKKKTL